MHKVIFAALAIIVLAGCGQVESEVVKTPQKEAAKERVVTEKSEGGYKTFVSADFGFSVDVPRDWKMSEGNHHKGNEPYILFEKNEDNRVFIAPQGNFGHDKFSDASIVKKVIVDGQNINITFHKEGTFSENPDVNASVFVFQKYPDSWNEKNRVEFTYSNTDFLNIFLETFRFN